jgi:transposase
MEWHAATGARCPVSLRARAGWTFSGTHRWNNRQSISKRGAKRGASIDPSGYDAGKRVKGRKRHIVVDTLGLLLGVMVHPANVQDSNGALPVIELALRRYPSLQRIYADGGYQLPRLRAALAELGPCQLTIVKRSELHRFVVLPKRWIVERSFAWISRFRRLARDYERFARISAAFVQLAMIRIMLRRLTKED